MSSLTRRWISALLALAFLFGTTWVFGAVGLYWACFFIALASIVEYSRVGLKAVQHTVGLRTSFTVTASILFSIVALYKVRFEYLGPLGGLQGFVSLYDWSLHQSFTVWACLVALFFSTVLWVYRGHTSNKDLFRVLTACGMGLIYCGFFPAFCLQLFRLPGGDDVILGLLTHVFLGDTFAYFGGKWFGQKKIMESVSPKKTWAGAYSGVLGTMVGATLTHMLLLKSIPYWWLLLLSIPIALVAQSGDFFMSLVKRVAHVKDSGNIMPGHGGILDRLDGVYFAAPVFFVVVDLGYKLV